MVNCQSLANYNICTCKYIERIRNDTCLTSSRDVHVHVFQLKYRQFHTTEQILAKKFRFL